MTIGTPSCNISAHLSRLDIVNRYVLDRHLLVSDGTNEVGTAVATTTAAASVAVAEATSSDHCNTQRK